MPSRTLIGIGVLSSALVSVIALQLPQIDRQEMVVTANEEILRRTQNIRLASALQSVGLGNLAAGYLWLDFIQYFGDFSRRQEHGYELNQTYLQAITNLDPRFLNAYLFSTVALAWKQARPQAAVDLLLEGTQHITPDVNPQAYRLWYQIALIEGLWLTNGEATEQAFDKTAEWIERLSPQERQQVLLQPEALRDLGRRLRQDPRGNQIRFDIWSQVFAEATTIEGRQLALTKIQELGGLQRNPDGTFIFVRPSS